MTYNVFGGTLSLPQSINRPPWILKHYKFAEVPHTFVEV